MRSKMGQVAVVMVMAALEALAGCGAAVTPQLVQCKLDALRVLPSDPKMFTPYDGEDLINRLKACESAAAPGDAGTP